MPYYVEYDSATPDPKPTLGWYDTTAVAYPALPPDDVLLEVTEAQWASHMQDLRQAAWTIRSGALVHEEPVPPPLTAQQAYAALVDKGITITSSSMPTIDGTYAVDDQSLISMGFVVTSIVARQHFPRGGTTNYPWPLKDPRLIAYFPSMESFLNVADAISAVMDEAKFNAQTGVVTMPNSVLSLP